MSHSSQNCTNCGSSKCTCSSSCSPNVLNTCTPGHFFRIEADAYQATCIPKGFPFWVNPGPGICEGLHIGSGTNGDDGDRVMLAEDFLLKNGFAFDGCFPVVDKDYIINAVGDDCGSQIHSNINGSEYFLICSSDTKKRLGINDVANYIFENACFNTPREFEGCAPASTVEFYKDGDCWKLGTRSAQSKASIFHSSGMGAVNLPPNTDGIWPDDFPGAKYSVEGLRAADQAGGNGGTGTIDEEIIKNNIVSSANFVLDCSTQFSITSNFRIVDSATVDEAYKRRTYYTRRYRVNGGPWQYRRYNTGTTTGIITMGNFSGVGTTFEDKYVQNINITDPGSEVEWQLLCFSYTDSATSPSPVRIPVDNNTPESGQVATPQGDLLPTGAYIS